MSRYHYQPMPAYGAGYGMGMGMGQGVGCGGHGSYNFSTLIILILIILQWSRRKGSDDCEEGGGWLSGWGDNGILFIIAIFFLVCGCGFGKGACNVGYMPSCGCGCGY